MTSKQLGVVAKPQAALNKLETILHNTLSMIYILTTFDKKRYKFVKLKKFNLINTMHSFLINCLHINKSKITSNGFINKNNIFFI